MAIEGLEVEEVVGRSRRESAWRSVADGSGVRKGEGQEEDHGEAPLMYHGIRILDDTMSSGNRPREQKGARKTGLLEHLEATGAAGQRTMSGSLKLARGASGELRWRAGPRRRPCRACRRAAAAAGVERARRAVSGALLRSRSRCRCRCRCWRRCRSRRAVIGRRSCSSTSAADGSPGAGVGASARARACAAGRGSIGVAASRVARVGTTPG